MVYEQKQCCCSFKKLLLILLFVGINICCVCAQTYKKNIYGLKIIDNIINYQAEIKQHPDCRLVSLAKYIPDLKTDFVYATADNFTHQVLYKNPRPYSVLSLATALRSAAVDLQKLGLGIYLFDAYRPYSVTRKMWQIVPDDRYAANPKNGSGHNRGTAVDISLYYLHSGKLLEMPTGFDDFTEKAHSAYIHLPKNVIANRDLLRRTMQRYGLIQLSTEWWHFYLPDPQHRYELLDLSFDELAQLVK